MEDHHLMSFDMQMAQHTSTDEPRPADHENAHIGSVT